MNKSFSGLSPLLTMVAGKIELFVKAAHNLYQVVYALVSILYPRDDDKADQSYCNSGGKAS